MRQGQHHAGVHDGEDEPVAARAGRRQQPVVGGGVHLQGGLPVPCLPDAEAPAVDGQSGQCQLPGHGGGGVRPAGLPRAATGPLGGREVDPHREGVEAAPIGAQERGPQRDRTTAVQRHAAHRASQSLAVGSRHDHPEQHLPDCRRVPRLGPGLGHPEPGLDRQAQRGPLQAHRVERGWRQLVEPESVLP